MSHQQPPQQVPPQKKRKQTSGGSVPAPPTQQMASGANPPAVQGLHPALAQQMLLRKMPEPEDPTIAEMEELNPRDMAVARYRRRHMWMNEIFSPISLADMPPPQKPYGYLHREALADQVTQLERQVEDVEKQGQRRLDEARARFAAIEGEVSKQPDP